MALAKPSTCRGCPLERKGRGYAPADGSWVSDILFVGEALGAQEASRGIPFVGESGLVLNKMFQLIGLDRRQVMIDNVCRCQPPGNELTHMPWEHGAVLHCKQYLEATIERLKPKVIVPMGNQALRWFTGRWGIERLHGYVYGSLINSHKCYVIPTFHPAFVLRGTKSKKKGQDGISPFALLGTCCDDVRRALRVAKEGYIEPPFNYILDPTDKDKDRFYEGAKGRKWLFSDIETESSSSTDEDEFSDIVESEISRISFCYKAGYALTVRWTKKNIPFIAAMLDLDYEYVSFWNKDFDVPRILGQGVGIRSEVLCSMWAWHFLQSDVLKKLAFAASLLTELSEWKSLANSQQEFYSAKDSDGGFQCFVEIHKRLTAEGRWNAFIRHCHELDPVLKGMSRRGILIDQERKNEFRAKLATLREDIETRIQLAVPDELKKVKVYKRPPKDVIIGFIYKGGAWTALDTLQFPFNVGSTQQVQKYIKYRMHPMPRHHKTKQDTTSKDEIERLHKKYPRDPLYGLIVERREYDKVIGTYIDGYVTGPDDRLRCHYTFKPSTGRLAAERPNLQNVRKRWELASEYRRQFVSAPEHVLAEFDYRAIEALIVGYYAKDEGYIRAARLGVHAILAAIRLETPVDLSLPDHEIRPILHGIKKANGPIYESSKTIVHLSNYGGTAYRIHMTDPISFPSLASAEQLQSLYYRTIGKKVKQWQHDTIIEAHEKHYLQTVFNFRHWFWNVLVWDSKKGQLVWGSSAKDALAFRPQSTAADVIKEAMLRVPHRDHLLLQVHDSLVFELPREGLDERIGEIKSVMERPVPELDGLSIEVEAQVGENWGEMEDWE
uniref:Putative DNA polymerase n=1 Tax=viral metagenome TaxID=1070528 RepID=A0A6M3K042_9ZZZZ